MSRQIRQSGSEPWVQSDRQIQNMEEQVEENIFSFLGAFSYVLHVNFYCVLYVEDLKKQINKTFEEL